MGERAAGYEPLVVSIWSLPTANQVSPAMLLKTGRAYCNCNDADLHGTFCLCESPRRDEINVCTDSRRRGVPGYR